VISASPAEVELASGALDAVAVPRRGAGRPQKRPERVIADRAYESDRLRDQLAKLRMQLIVPHRQNRRAPSRNDGRTLRRHRKRWKVERTFAWLGNYRRLVVGCDRSLKRYRAFFRLACALITLRFLDK
jgi:transposase